MTIIGLYNKVKKLDTDKVITEAFEQTTEQLADKNKKQLYSGFDSTGEKISRKYRNNKYARVKNEMNPLPGLGIPDLRVAGAFYRGIEVRLNGQILITSSLDEKGPELEEKYDDIFGLGGEFKKEFLEEDLRPALNSEITKVTGLKFSK